VYHQRRRLCRRRTRRLLWLLRRSRRCLRALVVAVVVFVAVAVDGGVQQDAFEGHLEFLQKSGVIARQGEQQVYRIRRIAVAVVVGTPVAMMPMLLVLYRRRVLVVVVVEETYQLSLDGDHRQQKQTVIQRRFHFLPFRFVRSLYRAVLQARFRCVKGDDVLLLMPFSSPSGSGRILGCAAS